MPSQLLRSRSTHWLDPPSRLGAAHAQTGVRALACALACALTCARAHAHAHLQPTCLLKPQRTDFSSHCSISRFIFEPFWLILH
eukprot:204577-Pleurochrysis_carterae.AAC.2